MSSPAPNRDFAASAGTSGAFPLDRWYVAGMSRELTDKPIARTLLNRPVVLFRSGNGLVVALEDRCCHKSLPLSCGKIEANGLRCGYHGLLFGSDGICVEIPGQVRIPTKARVKAYTVCEQDQIIWIWMSRDEGGQPASAPPRYFPHDDPKYQYGFGKYHYRAPWQLIHDNLMDLSHLGYVHLQTIGGNAALHMSAPTRVSSDEHSVHVVRHMLASVPPPTYRAAYPFGELCDRWQEIEFHVSHLAIWTGAVVPGSYAIDDKDRGGFHMRGFHGVTPETADTCHYFWSMATNRHPDMPDMTDTVVDQTRLTFDEDRAVIEAQFANIQRFGSDFKGIDIHVDTAPNRARRIIASLLESQ